ncbi:MAG: chloride channel protein [bacterium]
MSEPSPISWIDRFRRLVNEKIVALKVSPQTFLIGSSLIVGLLSGGGYILLRETVSAVHHIIYGQGESLLGMEPGSWTRVFTPLLPVAGALLLIPLALLFPGEVNGYRFPKFLEKVNIQGGVIRARTILITLFASAFTIGSGGSAGLEGPIAQIGGAIGSNTGHIFKVSGNRMKVLIACGTAGGIAAAFNAPIAGVLFALEIVLLGDFALSNFSPIVISSGIATVVSRAYFGQSPIFMIRKYVLVSNWELLLYAIMGTVIGVSAVIFISIFYRTADFFERLDLHPLLKPLAGAFCVGALGIFFPQIMGTGYGVINDALRGDIALGTMMIVVLLKMVATSLTLGSGGAGGMFGPSLFIGLMIGGSFGGIVHPLFPDYTAPVGAYAFVGMGAFLAAVTHAPLTAIFLLFEVTQDYRVVLPVLFATVVGTLIARALRHDSIDTETLRRRGIDLHAGREMSLLRSVRVRDVMSEQVTVIPEHTPFDKILAIAITSKLLYFPVVDLHGKMTGILSFQDIKESIFEEELKKFIVAKDISYTNVITVTPEDHLDTAMEKFGLTDVEVLPVVDPTDPQKLLGMLSRKDVITAYNQAMLKRKMTYA